MHRCTLSDLHRVSVIITSADEETGLDVSWPDPISCGLSSPGFPRGRPVLAPNPRALTQLQRERGLMSLLLLVWGTRTWCLMTGSKGQVPVCCITVGDLTQGTKPTLWGNDIIIFHNWKGGREGMI